MGGAHAPPPTQTYAPPPKTTMFFSVCGGGMVFLTFKWGGQGGGHVFEWGGGQSGGAHAPPTQTYAPHLKPLCFLVCVWVRLMWKSGGGNLGGGRKSGGGKWGGGHRECPPTFECPPLKNTMLSNSTQIGLYAPLRPLPSQQHAGQWTALRPSPPSARFSTLRPPILLQDGGGGVFIPCGQPPNRPNLAKK